MKTKQAISLGVTRLSAAGIVSAESETLQLLSHLTGRKIGEIRTDELLDREISEEVYDKFERLISRRETREPLQHIIGEAPFLDLSLEVGPGVFVPRPETESLVEKASLLVENPESLIIDFGAGSGAISISLAKKFPKSTVIPVELSADAHPWLKKNIVKYLGSDRENLRSLVSDLGKDILGLDIEAGFVRGNMQDALSELAGRVDLIVSNPPYIPEWAVPVDDEVRLHDPQLALYGGEDGLRDIRVLADRAIELLKPGGKIIIEHASTQGEGVTKIFSDAGLIKVQTYKDLTDRARITVGSKQASH